MWALIIQFRVSLFDVGRTMCGFCKAFFEFVASHTYESVDVSVETVT